MNTNMKTWHAELHPATHPTPADPENWAGPVIWEDRIVIIDPDTGEEVNILYVESSQDAEPYDKALAAAGYQNVTWVL